MGSGGAHSAPTILCRVIFHIYTKSSEYAVDSLQVCEISISKHLELFDNTHC